MEKVKCNCNETGFCSNYSAYCDGELNRLIRNRLTEAATTYFPDLPLVGTKQCFYIHHEDGSRFANQVLTARPSEIEWLEKMKMPFVLCEIIDDKGYLAIKLKFFNC